MITQSSGSSYINLTAGSPQSAGSTIGNVSITSTVGLSGGRLNLLSSALSDVGVLDANITGSDNPRYLRFDTASISDSRAGTRNYYFRAKPSQIDVRSLTATKTYDGNRDASDYLDTSNAYANLSQFSDQNHAKLDIQEVSASFSDSYVSAGHWVNATINSFSYQDNGKTFNVEGGLDVISNNQQAGEITLGTSVKLLTAQSPKLNGFNEDSLNLVNFEYKLCDDISLGYCEVTTDPNKNYPNILFTQTELEELQENKLKEANVFAPIDLTKINKKDALIMIAKRKSIKQNLLKVGLEKLYKQSNLANMPFCSDFDPTSDNCIVKVGEKTENPLGGRKLALLIGINHYKSIDIEDLVSPIPDVREIGKALKEELNFEPIILEDAKRGEIVLGLNKLVKNVYKNDSIIIYFAGHGYFSDKLLDGFWLTNDSDPETPKTWLANKDISKYIKLIGAKNILLVSDSCYSGTLVDEINNVSKTNDRLQKKSHGLIAISSGGNEPVSDQGKNNRSVFSYHFEKSIRDEIHSQDSLQLFEHIRKVVTAEFPQTPQYGIARSENQSIVDRIMIREKKREKDIN